MTSIPALAEGQIAEIARLLTMAQRDSLTVMQEGQQYGYDMISGGLRGRLFRKNLLCYAGTRDGGPVMELTDLGARVRAHLEGHSDAG